MFIIMLTIAIGTIFSEYFSSSYINIILLQITIIKDIKKNKKIYIIYI